MSSSAWEVHEARRAAKRYLWIGLGVITGLIVLYFIGLLSTPTTAVAGYRRVPPDPNVDPAAANAYVKKLAVQSGGNYERLSEDDRIFLNGATGGHGRELLTMTARQQRPGTAHENKTKKIRS